MIFNLIIFMIVTGRTVYCFKAGLNIIVVVLLLLFLQPTLQGFANDADQPCMF